MRDLIVKAATTEQFLALLERFLGDRFGRDEARVALLDDDGLYLLTVQAVYPDKLLAHLLEVLRRRSAVDFEVIEVIEDSLWTSIVLRLR